MTRLAAGFIVYRWFDLNLQFLLLQTSYGINHWTPPKGHVDPGETTETAAIRETEEEAGLSVVSDLRVDWNFRRELQYMTDKKTHKTVIYWLAELISGKDVKLSSEHQSYNWLSLVDACNVSAPYSDMQNLLKEASTFILEKKADQ